jgi:hypothetical protein
MVERGFAERISVADLPPTPTGYSKPRSESRDVWLVLCGATLGAMASVLMVLGLYLLIEMGM